MSRHQRVEVGSVFLVLVLVLAGLVMLPATAAGQTTNLTPTPTMTTTTATTPALALSTSSGLAGSNITANGSGFKPAETVDVTFNGQSIGKPTVNDGGTFSLSFTVPNVPPGQYVVGAKERHYGRQHVHRQRGRRHPGVRSAAGCAGHVPHRQSDGYAAG